MSQPRISIPIKMNGKEKWAQLTVFGESHTIVGERFNEKNANYSHFGGHRVRLYVIKKNVHWLVPDTAKIEEYDISAVKPGTLPQRRQ